MILFDAHVHIYDGFDLDVFFEAVFNNFRCNAEKLGSKEECVCFLLLAESNGWNYFSKLQGLAGSNTQSGDRFWSITVTEENTSLRVMHTNYPGVQVIVAAGRQLSTSDGLELLALLTGSDFPDGMKLGQAAKAVAAEGGIPVCPWGAGKWLGKRGRVLSHFMKQNPAPPVLLGDSGGRPSFWPCPQLLSEPYSKNRIVSGSDPLPLGGEERRAGSYGGYIETECSSATPAASLRELLLLPGTVINSFGRQLCPMSFLLKQVSLRFR
jgi:hypothetical protein